MCIGFCNFLLLCLCTNPFKIFGIRRHSPTFITTQKEKKRIHKKSLSVQTYYVGQIQPHSPEIFIESSTKLNELALRDKERMMLEEAKNKVESYIYKIKNKLSDDEETMEKFATEEERSTVLSLADKAEDWLYDDGSTADLATMEDKFVEISTLFERILVRIAESTARPKAIDALNKKITDVENLLVKWEETKPHITVEERESVIKLVDDVRKWIEEKEAGQAKLKDSDDPSYLSAEIPLQFKPIEVAVVRLDRKPKPKPPPKNETESTNSTETNATSSSTNETATNETSTNETMTTNETDDTIGNNTDATNSSDSKSEIPVNGGLEDEL